MKGSKNKFESEAALCAAFIAVLPETWQAYAETAGWDILLVNKLTGIQIGVEAKLRMNVEVVNQAIESFDYGIERSGPDFRAVLVPGSNGGFDKIAQFVGLTIIRVSAADEFIRKASFSPPLPDPDGDFYEHDWHQLFPTKRHELPEYVPDVGAGCSAPVQLTKWKIAALKLLIVLERRGFVVRSDFLHLKIDHRRWTAPGTGWLIPGNRGWIRSTGMPDFKAQHPVVYDQIAADADKWMPPPPVDLPMQRSML